MGVFIDTFRRTMTDRQRTRFTEKIRKIAEEKLAEGEPIDKVVCFVGGNLGCPCCGPSWWRELAIRSYIEKGEALPPELTEVNT